MNAAALGASLRLDARSIVASICTGRTKELCARLKIPLQFVTASEQNLTGVENG
jgi:hypothetical protein